MYMVSMLTYFFSVRGFGHPVFLKPHFGHPVMKILAKTLLEGLMRNSLIITQIPLKHGGGGGGGGGMVKKW